MYNDGSINHGFLVESAVAVPAMLDAVEAKHLTKLSGTAEANSTVSVFDGTNLVDTVTAAADGTWTLNANVTGNVIHSYTETSSLAGNSVSSAGVTLYTPAARSVLTGGTGDDVLIGRPNDTLTGNGGADRFVFNPDFGKETINDFNSQQHDVIAFDKHVFADASQVLSHTTASANGADAVITYDAANHVTLIGVHVADLHASDFAFF